MLDQLLLITILFLPLFISFTCLILPKQATNWYGWLFSGGTLIGLLSGVFLYARNSFAPEKALGISWFSVAKYDFTINILLDSYSYLMFILVYFISLMVGVFSIEYMKTDNAKNRYFAFLAFFIFSMLGVVLSGNLFQMYIFWELVGFTSYLIIGFWYEKPKAIEASKKAFLMNRIGDFCFLIGIFMCYDFFKTTNLQQIQASSSLGNTPTIIGLLFLVACIAKSAQFPLHTWLPDAMEGPTPASALIHAATMVVAGIYLLIRVFNLFNETSLLIVASIGAISMIMGGIKGFLQSDIKKVLAYSTISQLGLMVLAVGLGVPSFAFFHLITHAFFKAGLFLCAGSVIYSIHEANHETESQNMYLMGDLRKKIPVTFYCYLICAASLIGLPFFSGFISKDIIIETAFHGKNVSSTLFFICLLFSSFLTALYMTRQLILIFGSTSRMDKNTFEGIKENNILLLLPIVILAAMSTWLIIFVFNTPKFSFSIVAITTSIISSFGIFLTYYFRNKLILNFKFESVFDRLYDKAIVAPAFKLSNVVSFIDENIIDKITYLFTFITLQIANATNWIDKHIVDGFVNGIAKLSSTVGRQSQKIQSGQFQWYVSVMVLLLLMIFVLL